MDWASNLQPSRVISICEDASFLRGSLRYSRNSGGDRDNLANYCRIDWLRLDIWMFLHIRFTQIKAGGCSCLSGR